MICLCHEVVITIRFEAASGQIRNTDYHIFGFEIMLLVPYGRVGDNPGNEVAFNTFNTQRSPNVFLVDVYRK